MELLERQRPADVLHYVLAYVALIVTAGLAALAAIQLRLSILILASARFSRAGMRLTNILTWIILFVAWAVYVLVLEHAYRDAITQARIRRARGRGGPASRRTGLSRALHRHDLDVLVSRFLRFTIPTLIVFVALFGIQRLLAMTIPG